MADTELKAVTDPSLTDQLNQAWQEAQGNAPKRSLSEVQQAFKKTGELPQAQEYKTPFYPGSPLREVGGAALQIGSAFVPPLMESGMFPMISRGLQAMRAGGGMSGLVSRALPAAAESAMAGAGAALQGGKPQDIGMAAGMPFANRMMAGPMAKTMLGRPFAESVMPDQVRDAVARNIEKQFGPQIASRTLFEEKVRPFNDMFLTTGKTAEAITKLDLPAQTSLAGQKVKRGLEKLLGKYADPTAFGRRQMTLPGGMGQFGFPTSAVTLGNMYDDMKTLDDMINVVQKEEHMGNYASKLRQLKDAMLNDMTEAVPGLKDARTAMWKEGNVSRLWDIMRSGRPIDNWREAAREGWVNKAFNKSEQEDIQRTMEQMARLGGGEHWVGRILGHAMIGGGLGALTGHPGAGAVAGGAAGVLMPHVLGQMMANPGGRAFLRGLMKKYPIGMTESAANAVMQWYLAATQTGSLQDRQQ